VGVAVILMRCGATETLARVERHDDDAQRVMSSVCLSGFEDAYKSRKVGKAGWKNTRRWIWSQSRPRSRSLRTTLAAEEVR
jgi:hypothetical protein